MYILNMLYDVLFANIWSNIHSALFDVRLCFEQIFNPPPASLPNSNPFAPLLTFKVVQQNQ